MTKVKHIFFDLDHTLWHFDKNANLTLREIFDHFNLQQAGVESAEVFIKTYKIINYEMWELYRRNEITKVELRYIRFKRTFDKLLGKHTVDHSTIGDFYVDSCPRKTHLMKNAVEVLEVLKLKYPLHIITNGFSEIQAVKMSDSGLDKYFKTITSSEEVGVKKPGMEIFTTALAKGGATIENSVYIGDSRAVDVLGCQNVGMPVVWLNSVENDHYEERYDLDYNRAVVINDLIEILKIYK